MRKLVYLMATTADGFIADVEGGVDAIPQRPETLAAIFGRYPETCPVHARDILGVTAPATTFDTVIMGMQTHQPALDIGLTSAYPHLRHYVVTHRTDLPPDPAVTVVASDPAAVVTELKAEDGLDIWLAGGADLATQLIDQIDEVVLKVNPVLLGEGIPLFRGGAHRPLTLLEHTELPGGVVLHRYAVAST